MRHESEEQNYRGFEQGPIRPPSEAHSLLVRVTRNCPWNRCTFCPVYKGTTFSVRPVAHVLRDLDAVADAVQHLRQQGSGPAVSAPALGDHGAWMAARNWLRYGKNQVFLQDANSLVVPAADLLTILNHSKARFPEVTRVTSYARSNSIANLDPADLIALREAGLNRIHIGMESGSDTVLKLACKGTTQRRHILAGRKVKDAGMELSEYYMPGLGGREHLEANALETAAALNAINPDFIRLRTLAIPPGIPLHEDYVAGRFIKATDTEVARELLLFLEALSGITSTIRSDHILNLLPEVDGRLPQDKERLLGVVRAYLALDPELQFLYQVGRRTGMFFGLKDLEDVDKMAQILAICARYGITPGTGDAVTDEMMQRFI
jgi:biotin synthase-like enzyme